MAPLLIRFDLRSPLVLGVALAGALSLPGRVAAAPADAPAAPQATPVPRPEPGDVIPEFDTVSVDGKSQHLAFEKGSKTLLLFFQSGCPHCHKMIPEWNHAYKSKPAGLKVYGIMLDKEAPGFFILMPIDFPVLRSPGRQVLDKIKAFRVPAMVRVGSAGKVEDVVVGEADRMRVSQLFKP
jgi:thiol-disulfide isomerase/thioredoxin